MNLFLLAAVPLSAVVLHRLFFPLRAPFAEPRTWILGTVWALVALVVASFFGKWREFQGSLLAVTGGLTWTDAFLVPGLVVAAWLLWRPKADAWELGLWLVLVFSFAGVRDFAATSRAYDLNEYFLVPLQRVLLVLCLPPLVLASRSSTSTKGQVTWALAAMALVLTGPVFQTLSFAGWGWVVWLAEGLGLAAGAWWQKKAAPAQGGHDVPLAN